MLCLHDVSYSYSFGGNPVLDHCNFSIAAGEWVSLIGKSGAGKSTIGRICAGLLRPTKGTIKIAAHRVGWLAQNPGDFLVGATVEEDVGFAPHNHGIRGAALKQRVYEALREVGMTDKARMDPVCLSCGEKQRVALAGVLAMRPGLLILDEPTSMIDHQSRTLVLQAVARAAVSGCAILHITHNSTEAAYAKRVLVLSKGRVDMDGTPGQVFINDAVLQAAGGEMPPVIALWHALKERGVLVVPKEWSANGLYEALLTAQIPSKYGGGE